MCCRGAKTFLSIFNLRQADDDDDDLLLWNKKLMATPSCVVCVAGAAKRIRWMAGCGSYSSVRSFFFSSSDFRRLLLLFYTYWLNAWARARSTLSYIWLMTIRHKNTYQPHHHSRTCVKACVCVCRRTNPGIPRLINRAQSGSFVRFLLFSHDVTQQPIELTSLPIHFVPRKNVCHFFVKEFGGENGGHSDWPGAVYETLGTRPSSYAPPTPLLLPLFSVCVCCV